MKKAINKSLHIILFVLLLAIVMSSLDRLVERKASYNKYSEFFGQEQDFDVLFLGTSHVINGIFPMELWEEQGIVSYNLANHAETMAESYWILKNAMDYTTPKLVVLDIFSIWEDYKINMYDDRGNYDETSYLGRKAFLHNFMDSVPLSGNKYEAICDILPSEDRLEFLWNFSYYHTRWNELTQNDFVPESSCEKGAESRVGVTMCAPPPTIEKHKYNQTATVAKDYLDKIITLCQDNGIEILLVYVPYGHMKEDDVLNANYGYVVAEEYGINYVNFIDTNIGMNYLTDCYDTNAHLNPSGAKKITRYLGAYIKQHYSIPDHKQDEEYQEWNNALAEYKQYKIDNIVEEKTLTNYLMLLADDDVSCIYYMTEESGLSENSWIMHLLNNFKCNILTIEGENKGTLNIIDTKSGTAITLSDKKETLQNTSFGTIEYDGMNGTLYINDSGENYLEYTGAVPDIQIIVIDNRTGEVVDTKSFVVSQQTNFNIVK